MRKYCALLSLVVIAACSNNDKDPEDKSIIPKPTPAIAYTIIAQYPHDTSAYTQGLEFHNGKLYEGTGNFVESSLRVTDARSGKVERKHMMGTDSIFGEGITIFNGKIYQLTWESNIVYVYDVNYIDKAIKTFKWASEGWGLTHNGTELIVSDGTSTLYFVNPDDFKIKRRVTVTEKNSPVIYLNELEFIDGFVYANIYMSDVIVKINPENGDIIGKMDFTGTKEKFFADKITARTDYFNGIAYDSTKKTLFVTGKRWPKMFEVKLN